MLPPTPPTIWDIDALIADLAAQEWAQRPVSQTYLRDSIASVRAITPAVVNLQAFGVKGDGVTDDTAAFTLGLAAAAGKVLYIPPAKSGQFYKLTDALSPASNTTIMGCGLAGEIRQTVAEKATFAFTNKSNITFQSVAARGQGGYSQSWSDDNHFDRGIWATGGSGLRVLDCILQNFASAAIYTTNMADVFVRGCTVKGTHNLGAPIAIGGFFQYGVAITAPGVPVDRVRCCENDICDTAFGVVFSGTGNLINSIATSNHIHNILQHAMYMGGNGMLIANNVITEFYNHGIKLYAGQIDTQRDVLCNDNELSSSVSNGFAIVFAAASTGVMSDGVIVGNQIRNKSGTPTVNGLAGGILVGGGIRVLVSKNTVRDVYTNAVSIDNTQVVTDVTIDGNLIHAPAGNGISSAAPAGSARVRITGNKLSAIPGTSLGVNLGSAVDDVFVEGNTIIGGFNSVSNVGVCTNLRIVNNVFTGWGSEPFPLSANAVLYENNQDGKEFTTYAATSGIVDYDRYIGVNCVAAVTMTVPSAASRRGKSLTFIKTDASANAATISCPSTLINGAVTTVLAAQFNKVTIRSNGVTWFIVA